ncbi:ferredoxin [Chitinispirillales bacterium ANBcel5]|uniref:ferredoxin n=1 Tax=Cellulosispirillum alkaliphilum TaxID=3039283 RepID=UPI002A551FD8|nr:ferredoxin [Chitinispirillales bacterium ANBcel5]
MRVVVDECCRGCGLCASICPDSFDVIDGKKAQPRHKSVPEYLHLSYQIAAQSCPEKAIKIFSQV